MLLSHQTKIIKRFRYKIARESPNAKFRFRTNFGLTNSTYLPRVINNFMRNGDKAPVEKLFYMAINRLKHKFTFKKTNDFEWRFGNFILSPKENINKNKQNLANLENLDKIDNYENLDIKNIDKEEELINQIKKQEISEERSTKMNIYWPCFNKNLDKNKQNLDKKDQNLELPKDYKNLGKKLEKNDQKMNLMSKSIKNINEKEKMSKNNKNLAKNDQKLNLAKNSQNLDKNGANFEEKVPEELVKKMDELYGHLPEQARSIAILMYLTMNYKQKNIKVNFSLEKRNELLKSKRKKTAFDLFDDLIEKCIPQIGIRYLSKKRHENDKPRIFIQPTPMTIERRVNMVATFLQKAIKSRTEKKRVVKLTNELVDIEKGASKTLEEKVNTHRLALANKNYIHYRW